MCIHPRKLTCPLKDDGWKTIFLLEMVPFQRTTSLVVVGETNWQVGESSLLKRGENWSLGCSQGYWGIKSVAGLRMAITDSSQFWGCILRINYNFHVGKIQWNMSLKRHSWNLYMSLTYHWISFVLSLTSRERTRWWTAMASSQLLTTLFIFLLTLCGKCSMFCLEEVFRKIYMDFFPNMLSFFFGHPSSWWIP